MTNNSNNKKTAVFGLYPSVARAEQAVDRDAEDAALEIPESDIDEADEPDRELVGTVELVDEAGRADRDGGAVARQHLDLGDHRQRARAHRVAGTAATARRRHDHERRLRHDRDRGRLAAVTALAARGAPGRRRLGLLQERRHRHQEARLTLREPLCRDLPDANCTRCSP